jgi:transposase, IS30 family
MRKYTQINQEERCVIAHLLRNNKTINHIAKELKRGWETIKNEIYENGKKDRFGKIIYLVDKAQKKHDKKRKDSKERFRIIENDFELEKQIEDLIVDKQYSPEQVAGELALKNNHVFVIKYQSIYRYIYRKKDNEVLIKHLRRNGKQQKRKEKPFKPCKTAPKTMINDRLEVINTKQRIGDFEGDTVKLFNLEKLYTLVDRKSGYGIVKHCFQGTADTIHLKTIEIQKEVSRKIHSITYDNGVEFSYHDLIKLDTKIDIYFAHPYSSWERGCNENFNGLLRQYFPKKMEYVMLTEDHIRTVEDLLNNRPRKRLNFLSPYQVFVLGLDPEVDGLKRGKVESLVQG